MNHAPLLSPLTLEEASLKDGLPSTPGLYAWWIIDPTKLARVPLVTQENGLSLIYLGIAKSGPSAASDLRSRVLGKHIRGSLGNSTLRRSLAALLWEEQGWTPIRPGDRVLLSPGENGLLSQWMAQNLRVAWLPHPEPWTVEAELIARLQPPLNVMANQDHPFYPTIRAARAALEAASLGKVKAATSVPRQYEQQVAQDYERRGYEVDLGRGVSDWGVDLFARRGNELIAVQVKRYGGTKRPVNRAMVMELEGARRYFDCTSAALVTDGRVLPDARLVADKRGIALHHLDDQEATEAAPEVLDFERIWTEYIMPLEGKELELSGGRKNTILKADWSGVTRQTDSGPSVIKIEAFRDVVNHLLHKGPLTRGEINQQYVGRASSGIARILAEVPFFEYGGRPASLRYRPQLTSSLG